MKLPRAASSINLPAPMMRNWASPCEPKTWRGARAAARQGLVAGAFAGRMVLPASTQGLSPILSLSFDTQAALAEDAENSAVRHIDLALDVPQVSRSEQPYLRMRDVAIALAAAMDGIITDQEGRIISREAMDAIGADLEQLYDTLESRDLAAGSALARRLFS
jgi:hypothetical protein